MKTSLFAVIFLVLLSPISVLSQEQPDVWDDLSKDLAELQGMNIELRNISPNIMPGPQPGFQELSTRDKEKLEERINKMLDKVKSMITKYKNSPVRIEGFSIGIPLGVTIDFSIDESKF
jgi:hypothetical protein